MAEEILTVVFTGLIVVFAVLILLTALIWLFGKLFGLFSKKDSGKKKDKSEGAPESAPVKAAAQNVQNVQNVQNTVSAAESDGLTDEVLAVITAAVYSYSESTGTAYQVKGIRRVSSGRPAWAFAGIWDSTRPF